MSKQSEIEFSLRKELNSIRELLNGNPMESTLDQAKKLVDRLEYWQKFKTQLHDFVSSHDSIDEVGEFILDYFDLWK